MTCPDLRIRLFAILSLFLLFSGAAAQRRELSLQEAVALTLKHHYSIVLAGFETDLARLNNTWEAAGRFPTVGIDGSLSTRQTIDGGDNAILNSFSAGLGLDWVVFNGFRVGITKEKLEQLQLLSEGNAALVIEGAIEEVILTYYSVLLEKEKEAVLERLFRLSGDRYSYEEARYELGGSGSYQLLQARNVYLGDEAAYLTQQVNVRSYTRELNYLTGDAPATEWSFTSSFTPDTTDYELDELLRLMLSNNQRLKNQYCSLLLQENAWQLARSDLYPSVRFSAGLDNNLSGKTVYPADPVTGNVFTPSASLSFSYGLYQGGAKKRALEAARINREAASVEREEMIHRLTNTLYSEYDLYQVRKVLLTVAEEGLKAAEMNLELSEAKYRAGTLTSLEYRDVQLLYLNAALRRLEAIYNLISSNITLSRLTGGILDYSTEE
ncbi:MAG: TolC family protein [Bacteroidota bacterium]